MRSIAVQIMADRGLPADQYGRVQEATWRHFYRTGSDAKQCGWTFADDAEFSFEVEPAIYVGDTDTPHVVLSHGTCWCDKFTDVNVVVECSPEEFFLQMLNGGK